MLFLFNPRSGKEQIKGHLLRILDIFSKAGYDIRVHVTQCSKDAQKTVEHQGKNVDVIVCSGGDGSVSGTFRCFKSHRSAPADGHSVHAVAAVAAVCVRAAAACLRETALPPVRRLLL